MRRLAPVAAVALVVGALAGVAFVVGADTAPQDDSWREPGAVASPKVRPQVEADALRLLKRAELAPQTVAFAGTQYASAWSSDGTTARVLQVTHQPSTGTTWRAEGAGPAGGPLVHTAGAPTPSLLGTGAVALLSRYYSLSTAGTARVAGRRVDVVEARRPGSGSAGRPAARFWLDQATGLVLRREAYDARGRTTRATAFVSVTVRPAADDGAPSPAPSERGGTATRALHVADLERLRQHGWACPEALPGPLPLVDARREAGDGGLLHLSYADGIASVSVFQQRGRLDTAGLGGYRRGNVSGQDVWVRPGVPRRVVWSTDGRVYTVVADAPERTVEAAVAAFAAAPQGRDGWERLERGLDRVGSWFNPFD